jgi:hypothetical protein
MRESYTLGRLSCNDVGYDVLRAYGVKERLDPAMENVPNDWYDALPGPSFPIDTYPVIPLRLHRMSLRDLVTKEIKIIIPARIVGSAPPWREQGFRALIELTDAWDKMISYVDGLFSRIGRSITRR